MQGSKYIAAAGVAGAALMLLRRAMRSNLVTGRNRLKLLTPIPEDIEISQAVKLTPVRARVEAKDLLWPASAARVAGRTLRHHALSAPALAGACSPAGWPYCASGGASCAGVAPFPTSKLGAACGMIWLCREPAGRGLHHVVFGAGARALLQRLRPDGRAPLLARPLQGQALAQPLRRARAQARRPLRMPHRP